MAQVPTPPESQPSPLVASQQKKMSVVGLIGVILAGPALVLALLGPFAFMSWFFAIPAFVLGLVGMFLKSDKRGLPLAAIIVSVVAFLVSVVVFFLSLGAIADEFESDIEVLEDWTVVTESPDGQDPSAGANATGSPEAPLANGTVWEYRSGWAGEEPVIWEGTVDGVVEIELHEPGTDAGRCFALVGVLTPVQLPDDQLKATWADTPSFSAYVDGALQADYGYCDTSALVSAGYNELVDLDVTEGTPYPYFDIVYLPTDVAGDISLVVAAHSDQDQSVYSAADALELP